MPQLKITYDDFCEKTGKSIRRGGLMSVSEDKEEANETVRIIKEHIGADKLRKLNYAFEAIKDEH